MANPKLRLAENVEGAFYVDSTCIDCDTCRQLAPQTFRDHGDQSSVFRQPETDEEKHRAQLAIVACPTGSIGSSEKSEIKRAVDSFPLQVVENIYYCGFNSEKSFGAWSYLIVRKEGNILVDSPRFTSPLVKKIELLGGIKQTFLSHIDDVADHRHFAEKFGAERIMHEADGAKRLGIERIITGDESFKLDQDLTIIPVPGHSRGSQVLLYQNKYLFTGDHLAWSPEQNRLTAFRSYCWNWQTQIRSMEKLLNYDFEWVLPGHGRIVNLPKDEMKKSLSDCINWMKQ